ncbi:MAG: zf-TFIIB domain-containing protein [Pyrinomonadaceae bacterium]
MKCPACPNESLENVEIEANLFAGTCADCGGKWLSNENYMSWLEFHGQTLPEIPAGEENNLSVPQFQPARLCPKDRSIMIKYKVGRNIPFTIDRCGNCAGIWLDRDEWETLKSRNLHDELNKIFTEPWQEEVHREEIRRNLEKIYREKFGEDTYARIKDFKSWMDQHEKRSEILAYLKDAKPLQF